MSEKAAIAVDPNVKETAITSSASRDSKELEKILDDETPVATNEGDDDDIEYPTFFKLVLITIALCLAVFCMALDNTIIAVAIPKITDDFKALSDVGWYASSYLLCQCAFQLLMGKVYTFYSVKWTFLSSVAVFEIGSVICGAAPNSTALIIGRSIAGLGGAGLFSGALLIVAYTVPLRQRPIYMGMVGSMYGIASVAGPLLGGVFTDKLTWRWCFYINLPFGAVTCLFVALFFVSPPKAQATADTWKGQLYLMDLEGTVVFMVSVICLLLALQWGGTKYPWSSGRIIALLVIAILLGIVFVAIQIWKKERATVPPRIFMNRNVWAAAIFCACLGGGFFTVVYYLPIWFQAIKGVSAVKSGIMSLPSILGTVVFSVIAGGLTTWIGYYTPFMYLSTIAVSIGAGLMTTFEVDTGHDKWIGYQLLVGAGVGLGMQQGMVATQTVLAKKDIAIRTAIIMFAQTLGGALFVSVGQNLFTNKLVKGIQANVPDIDSSFVLRVGATELKNRLPPASLPGVLVAYNDALTYTWTLVVALSCFSAFGASFMQWKSVKGKKVEVMAA